MVEGWTHYFFSTFLSFVIRPLRIGGYVPSPFTVGIIASTASHASYIILYSSFLMN